MCVWVHVFVYRLIFGLRVTLFTEFCVKHVKHFVFILSQMRFICYATHPPTSSLSLLFIFLPYLSRFSWFSSIDFPFIHTFANECNKTTISHRWYTLVNISKMSDRVDSTHYHSLVSHMNMLYKNHSKCQRPRMRAYSHGVYQCET